MDLSRSDGVEDEMIDEGSDGVENHDEDEGEIVEIPKERTEGNIEALLEKKHREVIEPNERLALSFEEVEVEVPMNDEKDWQISNIRRYNPQSLVFPDQAGCFVRAQ